MQWHLDAGEGLPARSRFSGGKTSEKGRIWGGCNGFEVQAEGLPARSHFSDEKMSEKGCIWRTVVTGPR